MGTMTIELPERISQQIRDRKISAERLEQIIVRMVELYLQEIAAETEASEPRWTDSKEFVERLIAENRALFEKLARLP